MDSNTLELSWLIPSLLDFHSLPSFLLYGQQQVPSESQVERRLSLHPSFWCRCHWGLQKVHSYSTFIKLIFQTVTVLFEERLWCQLLRQYRITHCVRWKRSWSTGSLWGRRKTTQITCLTSSTTTFPVDKWWRNRRRGGEMALSSQPCCQVWWLEFDF